MQGILKKSLNGLMFGLCMTTSAYAANLTIEAPSGTVGGIALAYAAPPQKIGTESDVMTVKLTAEGGTGGDVAFYAIGIESPNFTLQDDDCGSALTNGSFCTLNVKFTPVYAGKRYAELIIRSNAENATNGVQTVYLQGVAVGKVGQTISFGAAPTIAAGGTGAVSATATSTLPVTYSSLTPSVCTVSGNVVSGVTADQTCTIAADQAGDANDWHAAPQATQDFTIYKANQSITKGNASTSIAMNGTGTVSATATSGLAVTYTSLTVPTCTVSGNGVVTPVATGSCVIAYDQAGNTNYYPAPRRGVEIIITAAKTNQTISFGTAPAITEGNTGAVSATATSGLTVAFTSNTNGVCTVSGTTVTGVAAGTCTIAANQAGNGTYNAAPQVQQSFTITAAAAPPAAGNELCAQYGITENVEMTRAGSTSKFLYTAKNKGYSFSFTTGTSDVGSNSTNYTGTYQYVTLSKKKCDYDIAREPLCAMQGNNPVLRYKVGGTSAWQCVLEPNTKYYFNVRHAQRNPTTKALEETCPTGSCPFMLF